MKGLWERLLVFPPNKNYSQHYLAQSLEPGIKKLSLLYYFFYFLYSNSWLKLNRNTIENIQRKQLLHWALSKAELGLDLNTYVKGNKRLTPTVASSCTSWCLGRSKCDYSHTSTGKRHVGTLLCLLFPLYFLFLANISWPDEDGVGKYRSILVPLQIDPLQWAREKQGEHKLRWVVILEMQLDSESVFRYWWRSSEKKININRWKTKYLLDRKQFRVK